MRPRRSSARLIDGVSHARGERFGWRPEKRERFVASLGFDQDQSIAARPARGPSERVNVPEVGAHFHSFDAEVHVPGAAAGWHLETLPVTGNEEDGVQGPVGSLAKLRD